MFFLFFRDRCGDERQMDGANFILLFFKEMLISCLKWFVFFYFCFLTPAITTIDKHTNNSNSSSGGGGDDDDHNNVEVVLCFTAFAFLKVCFLFLFFCVFFVGWNLC